MNQQERDVISGIFDRLKQVENQPRDSEAEAYIAERIAAQPYAPYVLAQVVHVQEEALTRLKEQTDALEAELEEARRGGAQASGGGGFLSGLFGGSGASEPPQAPRSSAWSSRPGQPGSPAGRGMGSAWQNAQQPDPTGPGAAAAGPWGARMGGGGGFLSTALTTAAGVAGGMVVGNMLAGAFGLGDRGGSNAEAAKADTANAADTDTPADSAAAGDDNDARFDQASYDDGSNNADFGAGDDADFSDDSGSDWV
jgi:hypothetical protein